MGDIIERLRNRMTSHDLHYIPDALSQEAADEIERLRKALTTCVNYADDMKKVVRTAIEALSDQEAQS